MICDFLELKIPSVLLELELMLETWCGSILKTLSYKLYVFLARIILYLFTYHEVIIVTCFKPLGRVASSLT